MVVYKMKHTTYGIVIFLTATLFEFTICYVPESDLFPNSEPSQLRRIYYKDYDSYLIDLPGSFSFMGRTYYQAYINGNGTITFGQRPRVHNYTCDNYTATAPTIGVYMTHSRSDQNVSSTAELLYRVDTTRSSLDKVGEDVNAAFPQPGGDVTLNRMLIVTWYKIAPAATTHQHFRNTFQAILTTGGGRSFVLFYYTKITWPTQDINVPPAQAGIYGGPIKANESFVFSGSCNYSLKILTEMSNIGIPGKFVFRVDSKLELPTKGVAQTNIVTKTSPYLEASGTTQFYFGDYSFTHIRLERSFKFLGTVYNTVYINGNGVISFREGSGLIGYGCNTNAAVLPTIGVYMADASDNQVSRMLYRQDTLKSSLEKVSRDVFKAFPTLNGSMILNWMLVITWSKIRPFGNYYLQNTFQAVLTTDGVHSFVLLYYNKITWPLTNWWYKPKAGIYGGNHNLQNSLIIPGSCNSSLINIPGMSNFGVPGKFVFRVDHSVQLPSEIYCLPDSKEVVHFPVQFQPVIVSTFRQEPLLVQFGIPFCLMSIVADAKCIFHDNSRGKMIDVNASMIAPNLAVVCPTPEFLSLGKLRVDISLRFSNNETFDTFGLIYVITSQSMSNIRLYAGKRGNGNLFLSTSSNIFQLDMKEIQYFFKTVVNRDYPRVENTTIDLSLVELRSNWEWHTLHTFKRVSNAKSWKFDSGLPHHVRTALLSEGKEAHPRSLKLSYTILMENGHQFRQETFADIAHATFVLARLKVSEIILEKNEFDKKCKDWYSLEPAPPTDTLSCPPSLRQAMVDGRFSQDTASFSGLMNPLNFTVFLQTNPSPSGAGSQCSYDSKGDLVLDYPYGSRIHRQSPFHRKNYWKFYSQDILPFMHCCLFSFERADNCRDFYFSKRQFCDLGYTPPRPFRIVGATHIHTFDGSTYLLNAIGTYWLIKSPTILEMQVLLEKYRNNNATTVITSAVMRSTSHDDITSKFQVAANPQYGLLIWMDDEPLNFYHDRLSDRFVGLEENFTFPHDGVTVTVNGTSNALFIFSSGFSVKFLLSSGNASLNLIGSASTSLMGKVDGLLGNFDGNADNDILTGSGKKLTDTSTLDQIRREFAEKWRVREHETLFQFAPRKRYSDYNNLTFKPHQKTKAYLLKNVPTNVRVLCENVEDCVIDYQLTGNEQFAKSSGTAYQQFLKLLNSGGNYGSQINENCELPEDDDEEGESIWSTFRRREF